MKRLLLLLGLLTIAGGASAQETGITVESYLSHDKLAPGQTFRIAVVLNLPAPWHCNANPASSSDFIPTTVTFETNAAVAIGKITYPAGKTQKVSWADEPVALYSGKVTIFAEGKLTGKGNEPVTIQGAIRYQACDDQVCYAPKTVPVTLMVEIGAGQQVHPEIFWQNAVITELRPEGRSHNTSQNSIADLIRTRGLFLALVAVFFLGMALNLTPCVFPMIAITVSYFGAQEGRSRAQAFAGAAAYCLGIVVSYSVLGVIAALTKGLFGALLQSPWVVLGIAALLVVLALSMFGLFELRPPSFLVQRAAGMSTRAGNIGVFFLGATLGIVAAPCLAPVVVALLAYVGTTGQWWWFLVFSCGLAVPYLILGTFSGLLSSLPKSGTWMVWVKRIFGTALLIVAVWFAWPVLGPKASSESPVAWQEYTPAAIENPGKPVVIDFYADWCIPCHKMDKTTLRDPRVVELAKDFVMVKVNLTGSDSPHWKTFKIVGVPTYVFLDAAGREHTELRQVGFVKADEFLKLMDKAKLSAPTNNIVTSPVPAELMRPF